MQRLRESQAQQRQQKSAARQQRRRSAAAGGNAKGLWTVVVERELPCARFALPAWLATDTDDMLATDMLLTDILLFAFYMLPLYAALQQTGASVQPYQPADTPPDAGNAPQPADAAAAAAAGAATEQPSQPSDDALLWSQMGLSQVPLAQVQLLMQQRAQSMQTMTTLQAQQINAGLSAVHCSAPAGDFH